MNSSDKKSFCTLVPGLSKGMSIDCSLTTPHETCNFKYLKVMSCNFVQDIKITSFYMMVTQ